VLAGALGGSYTLVVGKTSGDNTGRSQLAVPDFTTITAALNKIPGNIYNGNACSARYLVKVLPGVYSERVTMKPCVDIEGSGELTTKITAAGGATLDAASATVVGAKEAELRFLTVENTGGAANAIGIYNNSASLRLTHVTATASGGSTWNFGVENYHVFYASPSMTHVTATASGGSYSYGVYNEYSSPDMTNVTATGSGGSVYNIGVINYLNSSPAMTNVTARTNDTGSSGTNSIGVDNQANSAPIMTNVHAFAWGSTHNYGVRNYNSQYPSNPGLIRMINVTATGSGSGSGVDSFGVLNYNCKSSIEHSTLRGGTNSLYNSAGIVQVGASQLEGGVRYTPTAPLKCVASYDSDFTPLDGSCVYP
jgi:hypothetical protein